MPGDGWLRDAANEGVDGTRHHKCVLLSPLRRRSDGSAFEYYLEMQTNNNTIVAVDASVLAIAVSRDTTSHVSQVPSKAHDHFFCLW